MRNHKQFVETNIAYANERKEEIMLEMGSMRSGSRASSLSSTALRARARADAAAAKKELELQKKRSLIESESALRIQQQELALAKQRMDEQARLEGARLEGVRLEDAAAIAVNAIDDELGLDTPDDSPHLNLPRENPNERVQQYIETLCPEPVNVGAHNDPLSANGGPSKQVVTQPSTNCVTVPLSPSAGAFLPKSKPDPTPTTDQSAMKSYIEFMARRELIANKIEKFDNSPENFHTWKI